MRKNDKYPFNKRGITGKEQYIQDGIYCIQHCKDGYSGEAISLCIRDILINFYAAGWQDGYHKAQQ